MRVLIRLCVSFRLLRVEVKTSVPFVFCNLFIDCRTRFTIGFLVVDSAIDPSAPHGVNIVQHGHAASTVVIEQPLELSAGVDVLVLCKVDHRGIEGHPFQRNVAERESLFLGLSL